MPRSLLLLLHFWLCATADGQTSGSPQVTTGLGALRGSARIASRLGRRILAFRGIRYAEPPLGALRFQPALPAKPWRGVFDASEEGPACPQPWSELPVSEDCLRLNVYTSKLPTKREKVKRPVLVFFHHGGYYMGSGQSAILGPQYLLDHDLVLVTVNYRLSSLGFLSTGDSHLPGNLGLKDQSESLRWIKKNIAPFGGNPNSITIAGCGAGAWSVSLHLVSPMSKGLFHRAIASSGSLLFQEPLPSDQKHLAIKQAELLGCPTNSSGPMIECLRRKPVDDYIDSVEDFFEWYGNPILLWSPVVEKKIRGRESFLTAQPVDLVRQGKYHKVPYVSGITEDEFGAAVVAMVEEARQGDDSLFRDVNEQWHELAPVVFLYERWTERSREISDKLRQYYLNGQTAGVDNYEGLADAFADGIIGFPVHRTVHLLAKSSSQPVYYYKFDYKGRYSHVTWGESGEPYGVVHHDDLIYLFKNRNFADFDESDPEVKMIERLTEIWANFARTGEPNPKNKKLFKNVSWDRFTVKSPRYLNIGSEMVMKSDLRSDRMDFWDKLFPLWPLH